MSPQLDVHGRHALRGPFSVAIFLLAGCGAATPPPVREAHAGPAPEPPASVAVESVPSAAPQASATATATAAPPPRPSSTSAPTEGDARGWGTGIRTGPPSAASIRLGAVRVSGRLAPELVERAVRMNIGFFRTCFEMGRETNPRLAGRISVALVIGANGKVTSTSDAGSELPDPKTVACVIRGFARIAFEKPESSSVSVVVPLFFQSGAPENAR